MSGTVPFAVRLPNWVGDVCMALPALRRLHAPGSGLAPRLYGRGWAADLLAGTGWQVESLPRGTWAASRALRGGGAARGLLFTNSFGSALQMRLAGVRAAGYRAELRGWMLGCALDRPDDGTHEAASFWRLAVAADAWMRGDAATATLAGAGHHEAPPPSLALPVAASHRAAAAAALAAAGVDGPYTVCAPLAVGTVGGRPKAWPGFRLLARLLQERGTVVVACPGPGEEAATAAALPGARLLPGLRLGAYAAVLAGATRVVANDTGPMHMAAAVGAPVLGVFGITDPQRTRPWSPLGMAVGDSTAWPSLAQVDAALARLPGKPQCP